MKAYYNENDPYCAQWLRNLISAGHIAPGDVDERDIREVNPGDVRDYTQCHFFAGIGVWSHALRLAGWPDDRPVWTGSCPCQPYSAAGKGEGFEDPRHLWPFWFQLIRQCRPPVIFGEQVEAAIRHGWLDLVQADLEGEDYAVGEAVLGAHSVGAPHIRQRLYFVADTEHAERRAELQVNGNSHGRNGLGRRGNARVLADSQYGRRQGREPTGEGTSTAYPSGYDVSVADAAGSGRIAGITDTQTRQPDSPWSGTGELADADGGNTGSERKQRSGQQRLVSQDGSDGGVEFSEGEQVGFPGLTRIARATRGLWADAIWLPCRDGKARPTQPGIFPLAHGVAARMGLTCSACESETVIYENMPVLRKIGRGYEGRITQKVLQQRVYAASLAFDAVDKQKHGLLSSQSDADVSLRTLRSDNNAPSSSQGSQPAERHAGKSRDAVSLLSLEGAYTRYALDVRRLWQEFQSGVTPQQEQDLFCPVCERVGPHQCREEMGGRRVGRLRAYGNAIVAQTAQAFIQAYMECA